MPLARDGHRVLGIDLSSAMLARLAMRLRRTARPVAARCVLVRGDIRSLPVRRRFLMAIAAFHTIQHLVDDRDLISFLRGVHRAIEPRGWFAFDVFYPRARWLNRPAGAAFDRTVFHHPVTGEKLAYSLSHALDPARRALHMRISYQPLAMDGAPGGTERSVRLLRVGSHRR